MNKNVEVYQLVGMGGGKRWRRGKYQKTEDDFRGRPRKTHALKKRTRIIWIWILGFQSCFSFLAREFKNTRARTHHKHSRKSFLFRDMSSLLYAVKATEE